MQTKSNTHLSNNPKQEIENIKKDLDQARDFFCLAKMFDVLPEIKRHTDKQTRSLYQAVSEGRDIKALESQLEAFFGEPKKPAGKSISPTLGSHPAVKYLGSIRKEQALFLKEARTGFYYGVLEPDSGTHQVTIDLGFCNHEMSAEDHQKLENLVKTNIRFQALFDKLDARHKGRTRDIQFGTFLQLAELLKITCSLKVETDKLSGHLFIFKGDVIDAEAGSLKSREAAYEIASWIDTKLEIEKARSQTENMIKQPLIDILKEGLKFRKGKTSGQKEPKIETEKSKPTGEKEPETKIPESKPSGKKEPEIKAAKSKPSKKKEPQIKAGQADSSSQSSAERFAEQINRAQKHKKRNIFRLAAIIGGVGILLVVAGVSLYFFTSESIKDEYQRLLVEIEGQTDLEQRQVLLQNFISSHDQSEFTLDAEKKIAEIRQRIEEKDYNQAIQQVEMLSFDENYQAEASAIYSRFLEKYPESPRADEIVEKMAEIPSRIDAADFEKLKAVEHLDGDQRIAAYAKYLEDHPRGRYVSEVEQLISGMSEEYYAHLKKETPVCEQQNKWDNCIHLSSQYLKYFENSSRSDEVKVLKKQFEDKRDLILLKASAENEGDNFGAAKQIYLKYLETNPDSTQKEKIKSELAQLEEKLDAKQKWDAIAAYSKDDQIRISRRMYKLKRYIRKNSSGPYVKDAKMLLGQLQSQVQAKRKNQLELQEKRQQARLQQERERKRKEQERLQRERAKILAEREEMRARLMPVNDRFVANGDGTVTDSKSGLMWSLLDSHQELGNCLNYDSAVAYAENLETGGYQDWRLPSASDLAGIYKKKPFFPNSGSAWYWTSETAETGVSNLGGYVTTKHENVFQRQYKKREECGAVRAVRP